MLKSGWYGGSWSDDWDSYFENPAKVVLQPAPALRDRLAKIVRDFRLEGLPRREDLESLAGKWGVTSIQHVPIETDAMLYPDGEGGFALVVNSLASRGNAERRRFSIAHELGHLLVQLSGLSRVPAEATQHRNGRNADQAEEDLCNQIAAEILMPSIAFQEDAWIEGRSLSGLRELRRKYGTSFEATAKRMVDLMDEPRAYSIWYPSVISGKNPRPARVYAGDAGFTLPNIASPDDEICHLLRRAFDSGRIEGGAASITSPVLGETIETRAEAFAWNRAGVRTAIVFHYSE